MDSNDLTIEILRGMRQDIQALGEKLGSRIDHLGETLGARIDETNVRLDHTNARIDRLVEGQIRFSTEVGERLAGLEEGLQGVNQRLDNIHLGLLGQTIREHEKRIGRLEEHTGLT